MALNGSNGKLYFVAAATATTSAGVISSGNWYRITGKSSTGPLPTNATTGDIFYQKTSVIPTAVAVAMTSADAVQALTLTTAAFVTDITMSISKEKFDETVQTDDVKSYQVSSKPEKTGSISGYFVDDDAQQQLIMKRLDTVIEQTTTGGYTRTSPQTTAQYLMVSRDESTGNASVIWEWIPCIIEGMTADKPMEGPMSFSFNYTAVGALKPGTYIIDN